MIYILNIILGHASTKMYKNISRVIPLERTAMIMREYKQRAIVKGEMYKRKNP